MNENDRLTTEGLELIKKTSESTYALNKANDDINKQIHVVNNLTTQVVDANLTITDAVKSAHTTSKDTVNELSKVQVATEETYATVEELTAMVATIQKIAEELKEVVRQTNMA